MFGDDVDVVATFLCFSYVGAIHVSSDGVKIKVSIEFVCFL